MKTTDILITTDNVMFVVPFQTIRAGVVGVADTEIGPVFVAETEDGFKFFLTDCCAASGKGSDTGPNGSGVVCRTCYSEVNSLYGDTLDGYTVTRFQDK